MVKWWIARHQVRAGAVVALAGWVLTGCGNTSSSQPPVVLISLDTFRADRLAAYGNDRQLTPKLDAFAADSVTFEQCYAQSNWTLTSHASILTSLYPPSHGVTKTRAIDPSARSIAQVLKDYGYQTIAVVQRSKWLSPEYGFDRGFDSYIWEDFVASGTQNATIRALLEEHRRGPVLLFAHFYDAHSDRGHELSPGSVDLPYAAPERYLASCQALQPAEINLYGKRFMSDYLTTINTRHIELDDDLLRYLECLYDAGVSYTDALVGELLDTLRALGLYDKALIMITADHGEEFQEAGMVLHFNPGSPEMLMHVPLMVKLPGSKWAGTRRSGMVESIDLAPTIFDWLGVPQPTGMQGLSLLPMIETGKGGKPHVFGLMQKRAYVRVERWRLVATYDLDSNNEFRLYRVGDEG